MAPIITPAELLKKAKSKWHDITQKAIHANPVEASHLPFAFNAALELHEHLSKYRSPSTVKGVQRFLSQTMKRKMSSSSSDSDTEEEKIPKKLAIKSSRKSNVQSSVADMNVPSKSLEKNSQRVLKDVRKDQRSKLLLGGTSHQQTSQASKKVSSGPAKKAKEDVQNKVIQQQSKVLSEVVPRQSNTQTTKKISPDRNLKKVENLPNKEAERYDQNSNLLLDIAFQQQQTSQASLKVTPGLVMKESVPKKVAEHNGQQSKDIPVAAPQQSTSQPSSLLKESSEEIVAKPTFYRTMTALWEKRIGSDLLEKFHEAHVGDNETAAKWYQRNNKKMTANSNFVIVIPFFWTIDETVDTLTLVKEHGTKIGAIISQKNRTDSLDLMKKLKELKITTRRIETVKDVQKLISFITVPSKKSR